MIMSIIKKGDQLKGRIEDMKRGGFTLIELLVVIAIIALLMSILMPALAKSRKMTRAVMCASREKQWGAFFLMYTDDFDGSYKNSDDADALTGGGGDYLLGMTPMTLNSNTVTVATWLKPDPWLINCQEEPL